MKAPAMFKILMLLLGFGGMLALTPCARAQSEVSPDHFDGTDSWAVALARESATRTARTKATGRSQTSPTEANPRYTQCAASSARGACKHSEEASRAGHQTRKRIVAPIDPECWAAFVPRVERSNSNFSAASLFAL
jgi:hypothetical protein